MDPIEPGQSPPQDGQGATSPESGAVDGGAATPTTAGTATGDVATGDGGTVREGTAATPSGDAGDAGSHSGTAGPGHDGATGGEATEGGQTIGGQGDRTLTETQGVPEVAPAATSLLPLVGGGLLGLVLVGTAGWIILRQRRPLAMPGLPLEIEEEPSGAPVPRIAAPPRDEGLVARFRTALARSREALAGRFDQIFGGGIDESLFEDLELALLSADVGVPTTELLLEPLKERVRKGEKDPGVLREALRVEIEGLLTRLDPTTRLQAPGDPPLVILVVGVNGSGKTTTIGKLAARLVDSGKKVMLAAGDTFRAAASEQLKIWAERSGADIVAHQEGADPGAVVYDALQAAKARGHDVVIIDTAGRLQTKKPLMEQLGKVRRVIAKIVPDGPHETLLVLDGTMGQNGLSQARLFHEATPLTGVAVTKLDGTAKGGMILTIAAELELPVKWVGIGEKVDDLKPFEPTAFAEALA